MNKKILALLLALAMLTAMLAGCASDKEEAPAEEAPAVEESAPVEEAPAEDAAPEEEAPVEEEKVKVDGATADYDPNYVPQEVSLPITEEPTDYTIWMPVAPFIAEFIDDMNEEVTVIKEMANRTNMHFEWTTCHADVETEKFNLMIVAGEYADVIGTMSHYSTGLEGAINDDVIIDLTDLIHEYCPNYWNAINRDEATFRQLVTDSGYMGAFCQLLKEAGTENQGYVIRQDWLDELGLEMPGTITEMHDTMVAFKDAYDAYMYVGTAGYDEYVGKALNCGTGIFMAKDYELVCTYDQPEFKEYTKIMAQWYADGILNDDFYNDTNIGACREDMANDLCGYVGASASGMSDIYDYCTVDGSSLHVTAVPQITDDAGSEIKVGTAQSLIKNATVWSISAQCDEEKYEPLCRMVDYIFTEEGDLLYNWGVEGDAFVFDEEGKPQWTERITNDPAGRPFIFTSSFYAGGVGSVYFPGVVDMEKTFYEFTDDEWEAMEIFKTSYVKDGWNIPTWATMTIEEQEEYANYQSEMETYVESMTLQFVCGELDIDANWDSFIETIHGMNYERMYEIQNDVYQRAIA